jgi:hypothetical protein
MGTFSGFRAIPNSRRDFRNIPGRNPNHHIHEQDENLWNNGHANLGGEIRGDVARAPRGRLKQSYGSIDASK